jgi:hypothetical protein
MSIHNFQDKLELAHLKDTGRTLYSPTYGYMLGWGTTVGNSLQGWAPGALFLDLNAAAGAQLNINTGTATTASWALVPSNASNLAAITATATEINKLAGLGATGAEIDKAVDVSARIVNTTATTLAVTATEHGGRIVKISSAAPIAVTLPAAAGTGEIYTFIVNVAATATASTIKVATASTDIISGCTIIAQTDTAQVNGFISTATDDTITINGTTQGGAKGAKIVLVDIAANTWQCSMQSSASGTVATPFSASV